MIEPGAVIAGKYRIERLLGAGGMGAVYVATNTVIAKTVALKMMGAGLDTQADSVERFFREAMSASRVRHPAIVQIFDAGTHEGAPWMAMELLEGQSLAERLAHGPLTLHEVRPIFEPVLGALDAVHAQGIVHRDLKPDNIFLERLSDGRIQPKLLDFGIAKSSETLSKLTGTGMVMGTAHYLAPEQARDSSTVDHRSDVYAMGAVLYESLSGRHPHDARTLPELIAKLISEDPAPITHFVLDLPPALAALVHACLSRDPNQRPQRMADLAAHLAHALAGAVPATGPLPLHAAVPLLGLTSGPSAVGPGTGPGSFAQATSPLAGGAANPYAATSAPLGAAGFVHSPAPPAYASATPFATPSMTAGSGSSLVKWVVGLVALALLCIALPIVLSVVATAGSFAAIAGRAGGGGGGFGGVTYARVFESWRAPLLADVNGDGRTDIIAWHQQTIGSDLHELLCARDGRSGEDIYCTDVGEQEDTHDEVTVLASAHLLHFDHAGRVSLFGLRDGRRVSSASATVAGTVEEVCALDPTRLGARTEDGVWSAVTVPSLQVTLLGDARPAVCAPVVSTIRPRGRPPISGSGVRIVGLARAPTGMSRAPVATGLPDGRTLLVGQVSDGTRPVGMLAMRSGAQDLWQTVVPSDPLSAEIGEPEAIAVTREHAFVTYKLTPRGGAPRRVAAFRLADGARAWDVPLPDSIGDHAYYVIADAHHATVATDYQLVVLDAANGATRFHVGEPPGPRR